MNSRAVSPGEGCHLGRAVTPRSGTVPRKVTAWEQAAGVKSPSMPSIVPRGCHCVVMSTVPPGTTSPQELCLPRNDVTLGAVSPQERCHPRSCVPPGTTSPGSKTIHSTSRSGSQPAWAPSVPGRVRHRLHLGPTPAPPRAPHSLHGRVQQVKLPATLITGPDAGVPPQPLHGHGAALLESGHFVGVLAHDQTGVVLGREGRGESDIPASHCAPLRRTPHTHTAVPRPPRLASAPSFAPAFVPRWRAERQQRGHVQGHQFCVFDAHEASRYRCPHDRQVA